MMPMVFCASLPPWPSEYSEAEANCRIRNARSTANGVERTEAQDTIATSTSASRNPTSGDSTIASMAFDRPLQTAAEMPALATPPPTSPPISACELDEGIPEAPGDQIPDDRTREGGKDHPRIDHAGFDDPGADGVRDIEAEHAEGDEVEERRPEHRILRPQHTGRNDRRDRVGGVVQAVQEVEQQRNRDQSDQDG